MKTVVKVVILCLKAVDLCFHSSKERLRVSFKSVVALVKF